MKKFLISLAASILMLGATVVPAFADSYSTDFEPPFAAGSISGQQGWSNAVNPAYDQAVVANTFGYTTFGTQSFRISDAVASGSFGDWVFAKPLTDSVGETAATADGFSVGTRQNHFEMQFDIASTQITQQPGMHVSVSPDRGDGSRMSYLRFEDGINGIDVFFDDVQGTSNPANFVETQVANSLNRSVPHTVKLTLDTLDGPSNDVVKVWIDGALVHTGTSWENYYRYDSEAVGENSPRIVKTMIIQARGTATPGDLGKGFLFDNFSMSSSTPETDHKAPELKFLGFRNQISSGYDNSQTIQPCGSVNNSGYIAWEWKLKNVEENPVAYTYLITGGPTAVGFTMDTQDTHIYGGIPIPGLYTVQITGKDQAGNVSEPITCSVNYQVAPTPSPTPTPIGPPTDKDQCKKDGWKVFNNPSFKNQGQCVAYVETHKPKPGIALGRIMMSNPKQRMNFEVTDKVSGPDKGRIEYWNYEYPGVLHYKANALCVYVNKTTKESRFMFQIPNGHPGLSGLYVVSYVKDLGNKVADLYGHNATSSLVIAQTWCQTGIGFSPTMYTITNGNLMVH